MDNLSAMEVFVRVVQEQSFTAAARRLNLSPSATSRQVSGLEDRLGVRLLNRTTRSVSLTEEGAAFFERCTRILADVEEAELAVSALHAAPRGTLRVNAPVGLGRLHVAPLVPEFLQRYPELRLDLTLIDRFIDPVEEGADVVVRVGELRDTSLIARKLAPNRRMVVGSPEYFARAGMPATPADLRHHNCLAYTYRASRHEWFFQGPEGPQTVSISGTLESNHSEALHTAVLRGLGLALLPLWIVWPDLHAGRLVEALPDYRTPDSAIHAIYAHNRHLSPKVRAFVDFLAECFGRQTAWTDRA